MVTFRLVSVEPLSSTAGQAELACGTGECGCPIGSLPTALNLTDKPDFENLRFHLLPPAHAPHPCQLDEPALLAQCRLAFTRRGGPGGQHRNKVESAVVVTHVPTQVLAEANERRDQSQNRRVAFERLRRQLAWCVRSDWVAAGGTRPEPSALWLTRYAQTRASVSLEHWDFATLLAEALDHLVADGWEVSTAAAHLGVSTGRLAKLLTADRLTCEWINRQRAALGMPALRP